MLLMNPFYSSLYTYIKSISEVINKNTKVLYKSYDKEKDNYVFFICFDLKSEVKLTDNIFLKDIIYNGSLKFSFNKATNEVYVNSVPYINYANIQIPVFTSDIAGIIVELLSKYIPSNDIKIVFANQLMLFGEDNDVVNVIPDMANTRNHKLLMATLENIRKEENKVMAKALRYKEQQARLYRSQERAIAKKRKIYGIDPKEFASLDEFIDELTKKLTSIWSSKIEKIERHLKSNETKYKNMIKCGLKDNDSADFDIEHLLRIYLLSLIKDSGYEFINEYTPIDRCIESSHYGDEYQIQEFIDNHIPELNSKIKNVAKVWKYFIDITSQDKKPSKKMINVAIEYIFESDLHCEKGVFNTYHRLLENEDLSERRAVARNYGYNVNNKFMLYELFLRDYYDDAEFHPIFKKAYQECIFLCNRYKGNYFDVCNTMQDNEIDLPNLDLLVQINKLRIKLEHYRSLLNEPNSAVTKIYQSSTLWGSLMQLPYWNRIYKDPVASDREHEIFSLLMINPKTTTIDLDNMVKFIDGPAFYRDSYNGKIFYEAKDFEVVHRLMVTIPNSLTYEEIDKLVNYSHEHGIMLNFVCEGIDSAMMVKKMLISKALKSFEKGETYFKDWCFINVDPTFYDSFLVHTPTNKVLWHRYDYSSDYLYRRKELLSLDRQIEIALSYCQNGSSSIDYWLFDELLLGGYLGNPIDNDTLEDYERKVAEESLVYERQLQIIKKYNSISCRYLCQPLH